MTQTHRVAFTRTCRPKQASEKTIALSTVAAGARKLFPPAMISHNKRFGRSNLVQLSQRTLLPAIAAEQKSKT